MTLAFTHIEPTTNPKRIPSKYQQAIYEWFRNGNGNAGVEAVAGSGKTTSLVEGMKQLPRDLASDAGFVAFNKIIAEELNSRINGGGNSGVTCSTMHSLGFATLKRHIRAARWEVQQYKYRDLAKNFRGLEKYGDPDTLRDAIVSLTNFAQLSLTAPDTDSLLEMAATYNVEVPAGASEIISEAVSLMLGEGEAQIKRGVVDFNDMIWGPAKMGLRPQQFGLLAIDEAQDLNAAQMRLAASAVRSDGRVAFVGDRRQAIYMFAGALSDSFDRLRDLFGASILPLSICYRCPQSVITLAQTIVPQIECAPNAPEGKVATISEAEFEKIIRPGDMVLCRLTAPLIQLCFQLISRHVSAKVKGRDIGKQLGSLIKTVCHRHDFSEFPKALHEYHMRQLSALQAKDNTEIAQQTLSDKVNCLETCYQHFNPPTMERFIADVEDLFSDKKAAVTLSTVHRSKGLENPRVFVIKPEKLPLVWKGQSEAQYDQELNLRYVAITRAMDSLFFVESASSNSQNTPQKTPSLFAEEK
jgi:superfamily I DNA/RNA helicase